MRKCAIFIALKEIDGSADHPSLIEITERVQSLGDTEGSTPKGSFYLKVFPKN